MSNIQSGAATGVPSTTMELLALAKAGEPSAIEMLFLRSLPALRRWARGRLPSYARDLCDTHDLVQETLLSTLKRLDAFDARERGALQAYLRRAVTNRIRDEIRRVTRRPVPSELIDCHADLNPSPLELSIGKEIVERYHGALGRLRPNDRDAIAARLDSRRTYDQIARVLGKPNANAARVAVSRAVDRLIGEMNNDGTHSRHIIKTRRIAPPASKRLAARK